MKMSAAFAVFALAALAPVPVAAGDTSPIAKVVSLISELQAKVIKEGEGAQTQYAEFTEWCEDQSKNIAYEIKTENAEVESLKAAIADGSATISTLTAKVEQLSADVATDQADLKAATEIRTKESADFAAESKELSETIDMLEPATGILEREMQGGAAMLQLKNAKGVTQALTAMVQASLIGTSDASRLTAFVQSQSAQREAEGDADEELGAPAAAVYEGHSGGIVDTLQDLTEKASTQLDDARKKETAALHAFEQLKQSLEDELKFATQDMDAAKKGIAEAEEAKSTSEGDLGVTTKDLAADVETKDNLHHDCMTKAEDFEAETKSRGEELAALAKAKEVIQEATGGAEELSYGLSQVSLLQVSRARLSSTADLANFEAVRLVRDVARKEHSSVLAQLASRLAAVLHAGGRDPFAKIKGMISDMISKLEAEAEADATKKAYCDKELAETSEKKTDKTAEIEKLSTKINQLSAKSANLKEEAATLQKELANLARSQATMDKMRQEEHAAYTANQAEMEKGLEGVKLALKVLSEYYAKEGKSHGAATGAGQSIIGLLEVVESDFSKDLAGIVATEETAEADYEGLSKENEIEKTTKDQDLKYKSKEAKELDKSSAELSSDRSGVQAELDAVLEYLAKLEEQCVAKPESYAEAKRRREAELAGLKEALEILSSETALLQRGSLRGVRHHASA